MMTANTPTLTMITLQFGPQRIDIALGSQIGLLLQGLHKRLSGYSGLRGGEPRGFQPLCHLQCVERNRTYNDVGRRRRHLTQGWTVLVYISNDCIRRFHE
jgi:hypothetical protein